MKSIALVALLSLLPASAHAQPAPAPREGEALGPDGQARPGALAARMNRPTGMIEVGLGLLTLPGAEVCTERNVGGCKQGDSSPTIELWQVFRINREFALGAGVTLGLIPTTDTPRRDPPNFERDHSRGYLNFEAIARYYPYVGDDLEAWVGLTGGLVVVSDRFSPTDSNDDRALVGPRAVTIRTEGYMVGVATGGAYALDQNWSLGASLRLASWFLPKEPARDSLGDEASLTGRNTVFTLGVNIGYRLPL